LAETPAKFLSPLLIQRKFLRRGLPMLRLSSAIRSNPMLDILMLTLGLGLFALAIGYTYACERL